MRQCPDCEEKDRVIIAGKVFCANCGAPWEPTDPGEAAAYQQKLQPKSQPAGQTPVGTAAAQATHNNPTPVVASPPPSPVVSNPQSALASPPPVTSNFAGQTSTVQSPVASESVVATATPTTESASTTLPAPTSSSSPPTMSTVNQAATMPTSQVSLPSSSTPAPTPTQPSAAPASTPASTAASAPLPESTIGAEIHSLDDSDESVLSDQQIKEMVATQLPTQLQPSKPQSVPVPVPTSPAPTAVDAVQPPAATAPASTTPTTSAPQLMNDVVVPASPATSSAPASVPVVAPNPAVVVPTTTTTAPLPVATAASSTGGLSNTPMMSREEALKLALGEDADVAVPAGPAKPTAVVMAVIGLVLLGALLWKVNAPDISLRLAALRSGLTASVPGFVPEGWSKAQAVKTGDGTLSYQMLKEGKNIQINQQKSDWDSQAVLEQYVLKQSSQYLALQAAGLTIYIFSDNQAAWVNRGVLYTITGSHDMSQEDLIRMATSL